MGDGKIGIAPDLGRADPPMAGISPNTFHSCRVRGQIGRGDGIIIIQAAAAGEVSHCLTHRSQDGRTDTLYLHGRSTAYLVQCTVFMVQYTFTVYSVM